LKTWIFTAIVILSNAFGNLFLDKGVRAEGSGSLAVFGLELSLFWLVPGVLLLILWMLTRMALLGWADLTYVLPVTALGYVLSAVLAAVFLGERVGGKRWLGTIFIVLGTALVSATAPSAARGSGASEPQPSGSGAPASEPRPLGNGATASEPRPSGSGASR
jgi:drug/metabolite transporter (DMT)-like permease